MEPRGTPPARDITEAQAGTILNALILLGSGVAVAAEGALPGFCRLGDHWQRQSGGLDADQLEPSAPPVAWVSSAEREDVQARR
jgi:hypothetical protein